MARCLQHEVDHLDGKVFLDRLQGEAPEDALRGAALPLTGSGRAGSRVPFPACPTPPTCR